MIYLYDRAIVDDLNKSFNSAAGMASSVKVIDPEGAISVLSQIQNDTLTYPAVVLDRQDPQVDERRTNFTRMHDGVPAFFDSDDNMIYSEKAIPINLSYKLTVLTTNTVDMDEILRELLFKYINMYFLHITVPYEGERKFRFGVCITDADNIQRDSGSFEYINEGKLYESSLTLRCEGCVLVTYSQTKLPYVEYESEPTLESK